MNRNRNDRDFYYQLQRELGANKAKSKINNSIAYELQCPNCNRNTARMTESRSHDTFMLMCPACGESLCLNDAINKYGSTELKQKWHEASFGKKWYGIKNRTKPGPKKNFKKIVPRLLSQDCLWTIPNCTQEHSWNSTRTKIMVRSNRDTQQ